MTGRVSSSAALVLGIAVAVPGTLAAQRGAAPAPEQVTVVACVAREPAPAGQAPVPAGNPQQFMLADVRTGAPIYGVTGVREGDLGAQVGMRVEVRGAIEQPRTTPVLTTADGVRTGVVNSEKPGAAGIQEGGAAAHEPADALAATVQSGPTAEPSSRATSDPAYNLAVLPRINVNAVRRVEGGCATAPASATRTAAAPQSAQRPPTVATRPVPLPDGRRGVDAMRVRGCLARQTAEGTALTPQPGSRDPLVLTGAVVQREIASDAGTAVPGSLPSGSGSGTVTGTSGRAGVAPADAATRSFALAAEGDLLERLAPHVGEHVEIVATVAAPQEGAAAVSGNRDGAAGAPVQGRAETAQAPAHVSAPAERITVTSFKAVGGACR